MQPKRRMVLLFHMERAKGIEPSSQAWEACILPMNYARMRYFIILPSLALLVNTFIDFSHADIVIAHALLTE